MQVWVGSNEDRSFEEYLMSPNILVCFFFSTKRRASTNLGTTVFECIMLLVFLGCLFTFFVGKYVEKCVYYVAIIALTILQLCFVKFVKEICISTSNPRVMQ